MKHFRPYTAGFRRLLCAAALLVLSAGQGWCADSTPLKIFINKERLSSYHLGVDHEESNAMEVNTDGIYRKYEWARMLGGLEFRPQKKFIFRFGYNPGRGGDTPVAERFALGTSLRVLNHEVLYAWTPFSKRESMHYLSLAWRF
jgi:hypothetical protein